MQVNVPFPLRSYTGDQARVEANGSTLAEAISDLDARYPGFRFRIVDEQDRIRSHIQIFVNQSRTAGLDAPLSPGDKIQIILAISGG